jgi:hypothetical protein
MAYDFVQSIPKLDAFTLVLSDLSFQIVPVTLFLLKFFFDRFFFLFDALVPFNQPSNFGFELFDSVLSHIHCATETPRASLVLTLFLVKLTYCAVTLTPLTQVSKHGSVSKLLGIAGNELITERLLWMGDEEADVLHDHFGIGSRPMVGEAHRSRLIDNPRQSGMIDQATSPSGNFNAEIAPHSRER